MDRFIQTKGRIRGELTKSQKINFVEKVTVNDRYGHYIIIVNEPEFVKILTSYIFSQQIKKSIIKS